MMKRRVVVKAKKDEVMFDIDFISWKLAKCRIDNAEQQAEAQTDSEASDYITRQIETAVMNAKGALHPYVVNDKGTLLDDELTEEKEWFIVFEFGNEFAGSTPKLCNLFHRYIVDFALAEWFKLVLPNEAANYYASAQDWLERFKSEARTTIIQPPIFQL
jgi:hypothetical protein